MPTTSTRQPLAEQWQARQRVVADATARAASTLWDELDPADLQASFLPVLTRLLRVVVLGQTAAGQGSDRYVAASLAQYGYDPQPVLRIPPQTYVGGTEDGRDWPGLLAQPLVRAYAARRAGADDQTALAAGRAQLTRLVETETYDAGRTAVALEAAAEPRIAGYLRQVNLPACGRCLLLAGRFYRVSEFDRHPRDDCTMLPVPSTFDADGRPVPLSARVTIPRQDPDELFHAMTSEQQDRAVGVDGARLIREGAGLGQVVNARRGMRRMGEHWTTTGRRRRDGGRLSPAGIVAEHGDDPQAFADAMRRYGYA